MPNAVIRYPHDWLGTLEIDADEDGVRIDYRNLVSASSEQFSYTELRPKTRRWEGGDSGWYRWASFCFWIGLGGYLGLRFASAPRSWALALSFPFFVLALAAFLMRFRTKHWVTLYETDGRVLVTLPEEETKAVIDHIVARVPVTHGPVDGTPVRPAT